MTALLEYNKIYLAKKIAYVECKFISVQKLG